MFGQQIGHAFLARLVARQEPLAFDRKSTLFQIAPEIVDGHMVNVGRVVPAVRQLLGHRHAPAEHMGKADLPLREIGKRHESLPSDTEQMVEHQIGAVRCLQRLA